jgi:pilus assembly protein CpaB
MIRILVLFIALSAGGGAAWLALSARATPEAVAVVAPPPPPLPTQEVLIAAADLPQGQAVTAESFRWQTWPEQSVTGAFISKTARPDAAEKLAGLMVRSRFVAGEPIREDKLAPANSGFLSAMLSAGKRAVAVRVSAESSAGGFILPGDRVDVLQTQTLADPQKTKVSRTILKNVTVMAVDQIVDEAAKKDSGKQTAVIAKTATLELDPAQAEIIIAAEAAGMLALVLRSVADNAEVVSPVLVQQTRQTVRIFRGGRTDIVEAQSQ